MAAVSSGKPYTQTNISDLWFIRWFEPNLDQDELVWHRDKRARKICVLQGDGWKFQYDGAIPFELKRGMTFEVNAMEYHRLILGRTPLKILILEKEEL